MHEDLARLEFGEGKMYTALRPYPHLWRGCPVFPWFEPLPLVTLSAIFMLC